MSQSNGKKRELAVIAAKIPRGIVVRLDRAASLVEYAQCRHFPSTRAVFFGAAGQSRQRRIGIFGEYWTCPENAHRGVLTPDLSNPPHPAD